MRINTINHRHHPMIPDFPCLRQVDVAMVHRQLDAGSAPPGEVLLAIDVRQALDLVLPEIGGIGIEGELEPGRPEKMRGEDSNLQNESFGRFSTRLFFRMIHSTAFIGNPGL